MALSTPQTGTRTTWTFDPAHTEVGFRVRHMMVSNVKGKFTKVTGTILEDESNLANTYVEVDIDAASVDTGNEQRDTHLRSADFLDVENFPTITYKTTSLDFEDEENAKVTGELTVHGVTRPITLEATIGGRGTNPWGQEVAGISLKGKLNRKDWGLGWNVALETGGVVVGETVTIDIEIEAIKQQPQS
jgi:polyisoprenoid-binding protein YceI